MAHVTSALVDRCRARGLAVVELSGWQSRGESGSFTIRGVLLHHDAMGLGTDNVPNYMSQQGVNGSQLWIHKSGAVYFLAAGLKWHAGTGCGWRSIPANQGNAYCVGIETDHTDGQTWTAPQLVSMVVLTQEICAEWGIDPDQWCCGHREYAPGRKPDPENFDLDAWRAAVKRGGGAVAAQAVTDPDGWLDMDAKEEILDALKNRKEGSQSVFDELRFVVDNVLVPKLTEIEQRLRGGDTASGQVHENIDMLQGLDGAVANLRNLLYQPDMQTGGHSVREEVQWAALNQILPAVNQNTAALTAILKHLNLPAPVPAAPRLTYTIAAGDTLTKIANRFGASVPQLQEWNAITDPNTLVVGQTVTVSA